MTALYTFWLGEVKVSGYLVVLHMMFMLYATHNQSTALVRPIVFKERVVVAFCSTGTVEIEGQ